MGESSRACTRGVLSGGCSRVRLSSWPSGQAKARPTDGGISTIHEGRRRVGAKPGLAAPLSACAGGPQKAKAESRRRFLLDATPFAHHLTDLFAKYQLLI